MPGHYNYTTDHQQACVGSDTSGDVTRAFHAFLKTPDLPPYYKLKAYITLSAADDEDDPLENLAACHYYLNAADEALAECKDVYKDATDVHHLQTLEAVIKEERGALQKREKVIDCDSDGEST